MTPPEVPTTKLCPFCAETIQAAAIKCRFCGERLAAPSSPAMRDGDGDESTDRRLTPQGKTAITFLLSVLALLLLFSLRDSAFRTSGTTTKGDNEPVPSRYGEPSRYESTLAPSRQRLSGIDPGVILPQVNAYIRHFDETTWFPYFGEFFVEDGLLGTRAKSGTDEEMAGKLCSGLSGFVFSRENQHLGLTGVVVIWDGKRLERRNIGQACAQ